MLIWFKAEWFEEHWLATIVSRPKLSQPNFGQNNRYNFLIFDSETTTIGKSAEIIQIAKIKITN